MLILSFSTLRFKNFEQQKISCFLDAWPKMTETNFAVTTVISKFYSNLRIFRSLSKKARVSGV